MARPTHMVKGPQEDVLYASYNNYELLAVSITQPSSMYYTVN